MGYIIAGAAIWATGETPELALADYRANTGDDELTLETISHDPRSGQTYIMPATDRLLFYVETHGGDIAWNDSGDVADIR